ncbi:MAG: hypothetical protein Q7T30_00885 [Planctomycetota bacterium]|nr:hypothetical protein [Planctomycetota bacterium]
MTTEADRPSRDEPGKRQLPDDGQRATVLASLPNGMFRLRLADDREVVAHAAQDLRMAFARLLPGDIVVIDVSPFDPNKARIRRLWKSQHSSQQPHPPHQPNKRESS